MQGVFLIFLAALSVAFEMVSIGLIVPLIYLLVDPAGSELFLFSDIASFGILDSRELILYLFLSVMIIASIVRAGTLWMSSHFAFYCALDIERHILYRIYNWSYMDHLRFNASDLIATITVKCNSIAYDLVTPIVNMLTLFFILVVGLFIILLVGDPVIFIPISLLIVFYYILTVFIRKKISVYGTVLSFSVNKVQGTIYEALQNIREVVSGSHGEFFLDKFVRHEYMRRTVQARTLFLSGIPRYIIEVVFISSAFLFISRRVNDPSSLLETAPYLAAIALAFQRFMPIVQGAFAGWTSIKASIPIVEEITKLNDVPIITGTNFSSTTFGFDHKIECLGMNLRLPGRNDLVLKNISLAIPKSYVVGIIGSTGSGKSSLVDLIGGNLIASTGLLKVDDVIIDQNNVRKWQENVAFVSQNISLIEGSIYENIAFGVSAASIDIGRAERAAEISGSLEFIQGLKGGGQASIGENGKQLSGGQRQRLAIARALYRNPKLLILDEATSALDPATEKKVIEALIAEKSDLTIIMVAHRIDSLRYCDVIYQIEQGSLKWSGSFDDLPEF